MLLDPHTVASVYSNTFNTMVSDPLTVTFTLTSQDDYGCRHGHTWSNEKDTSVV